MSVDATTSFVRTLVDEWVRNGVTDACLAPGSRSAPLALALADDGRIRLHVHLDERSASFFALGVGKAARRPAIVLCTSGTAAANFHPAVLEAYHSCAPLVVCTADRPPELRDTGAGQTINQVELYGGAVRWFHDPGVPTYHDGVAPEWRSLAARAVATALGPPAGPVHLNLPFREPLVPTGARLVDAPGRSDGRPWTARAAGVRAPTAEVVDGLAALVRRHRHGVVVVGSGANVESRSLLDFAEGAGWPVLADTVSNARVPGTISVYDPLLRDDAFARAHRPDVALRLGGPLSNKVTMQWLGNDVEQVLVDPDGMWLDPHHGATGRVFADPQALLDALASVFAGRAPDGEWSARWRGADARARATVDELIDSWDDPFEGQIARDVVASVPDGGSLVVASSMPVRDVESFADCRTGVAFFANRGVNGIDGFVSTVLGIAAAAAGPTVALLGDLCFLHDSNGLLGARERGLDATFVVVDNDGGGIFSFLAQADLPVHFEKLFGTPHGVDIGAVARVHDLPVTEVTCATGVRRAIEDAVHEGGVQVVLVRTDRATNVTRHHAVWAAVADAMR